LKDYKDNVNPLASDFSFSPSYTPLVKYAFIFPISLLLLLYAGPYKSSSRQFMAITATAPLRILNP